MKKIIAIAFIGSLVFACSRKTVVTTETKSTTQEPVTVVSKANEEAPKADVNPAAESIAAGKMIYTTKCARCHGVKEVTAYTEKQWEPILKSMIPKSRLNDEEAGHVTAYVKANAKK